MTSTTRALAALSAAALLISTAAAGTFTLDGIFNPANDAYTHQFTFPLILDDGNGTPAGMTQLKVGIGANADGVTGGPNDLFVYFEMPLDLKDMTWGTGTHDDYSTASNDVSDDGIIAMNQNTGSEKIQFNWDGTKVEVKLSQRGNGGKDADLQPCSDAGTCIGHEIKTNSNDIVAARTSLDYIMNNFPNNQGELNLWGDADNGAGAMISNSPTLKQENGEDIYETVDPTFADWPFHQSWEIQIEGPFVEADLANLLTSDDFFGADFGDENGSGSNFLLHASPIKQGGKPDVVPSGDPEDYPPEPIIPEPSSLVLLSAAALSLGLRRRSA